MDTPVKTRSETIIVIDVYPSQSEPNWKVAEDTPYPSCTYGST